MYSQDEKDKMAMKNSTIDKFAARQGCPPGQISDGKGGCKDRIKNPSEGVFQDFGTRLTATQIKMREDKSGWFAPTGQSLTEKKDRTVADQKALDQDQKLYQYKEQNARLKKEKEAAQLKKDKAKVKEMQNKGGYKKQGF
jgi:hypothetical protein